MKDKLRELAERWSHPGKGNWGGRATGRKQCAAELLAILDAEGDGEAVSGTYMDAQIEEMIALHGDHSLHTAAVPPEVSRVTADMLRYLVASRTNPARSGVVSDEDVFEHLSYIGFSKGLAGEYAPSTVARTRAALEHFAKGERHER